MRSIFRRGTAGRLLTAVVAAALLAACGDKASTMDDLTSVDVTLPNGTKIRARAMRTASDLQRGMMYQESLPQDRGMLFFHQQEATASYNMFQVRMPLDIIFLDSSRRIMAVAQNAQPCRAPSTQQCPSYGTRSPSLFVLEANAGFAAKNHLKLGDRLDF